MGYSDDLKVRSSMTLFSEADPDIEIFKKIIVKFYDGVKDYKTIELLRMKK